jgi:uncharacterized UBP type Zn finger protein
MVYELYGVIVHRGSTMSSGHYTCFIKVSDGEGEKKKNVWFEFSDEMVRRVAWR